MKIDAHMMGFFVTVLVHLIAQTDGHALITFVLYEVKGKTN